MTSTLFALIRDQTLPASVCKQNANGRPPKRLRSGSLEATCRLPAHRPVPNYYSCLQTSISRDKRQKQLHARWANWGCSGMDMNLFMAKENEPSAQWPLRSLCLPRETTFIKTFPQNHYNSIAIPSIHYLHHDCICSSANRPPSHGTHIFREGEWGVCISLWTWGEALSSLHSPPAVGGQLADCS